MNSSAAARSRHSATPTDLEMLQWTTMSDGIRLGSIIHHTDAEHEYAYDRDTSFGRRNRALDVAG